MGNINNYNEKVKDEQINNEFSIENESISFNNNLYYYNNIEYKEKKNKGRYHSSSSIENINMKIKSSFWSHFVFDLINKNLIDKKIMFIKLSYFFIIDLKGKAKERMLKMKISDILYEQKISPRFTRFDKYYNRKIIDKIYEEKKEIKVIKILELTYEELFIIFRRKLNDPEDMEKLKEIKNKIKGLDLLENNNYNDIQYLIDTIKEKDKRYNSENDNSELNEYIEKIKRQCLIYEKNLKGKKDNSPLK